MPPTDILPFFVHTDCIIIVEQDSLLQPRSSYTTNMILTVHVGGKNRSIQSNFDHIFFW